MPCNSITLFYFKILAYYKYACAFVLQNVTIFDEIICVLFHMYLYIAFL